MDKTIYSIVLTVLLFAAPLSAAPVQAELIAGSSAAVSHLEINSTSSTSLQKISLKRKAMTEVLKRYDAPLLSEVDSFLEACEKYNLDCYLLPAISGVESTFGRFLIPGTYNSFGWGRGVIAFTSFNQTIMTVGKGLRENYIDKGADTVDKIGRIYCEGDTWSGKVKFFMNKFEEEEKRQLFFMQDAVQL
ncbi:hypothetical protein COW57_05075 [Candidatus Roizmanbacteria bacterium CG17_big_fil_post_rev_8_21_14_2_50_39_7]|uniref:Mannosyl-glycoprotein endo-beta-N-acetylglucosamidase-like domain-containing protein n=2 Tax=Candidatus Roizmaniibacteriota TaxID=1752723 RepID=A0A2M7EIU7_9BACT|nr:MAG: hypothetical protein COS52_03435 [Candidatus Roizmanbacteria bacterium CG03_land_8_20_14_0_80_39_12]PIV70489.1 MAG: hypothetical protein COW57_05075 [Candidatus Roizmanbacteria bacterium CG17_big_fil_post_rev_8_21_14_2_50_39_7]